MVFHRDQEHDLAVALSPGSVSARVERARPAPHSSQTAHARRPPCLGQGCAEFAAKTAWTRATIKEGTKGPIVCDFAFLRVVEARDGLPGPELWLVIRRNLDDPSVVKFYFSNAPLTTPLTEFVRLSGLRWPIETLFEESKGEVGLDHYEN